MKAAPVLLSQEHLEESGGEIRAIFVNSGNANACTGEEGMVAARKMTKLAGEIVAVPADQVLVCSTGVIGVPLPFDRIEQKSQELKRKLSSEGMDAVSKAIMTTTFAQPCICERCTAVTRNCQADAEWPRNTAEKRLVGRTSSGPIDLGGTPW